MTRVAVGRWMRSRTASSLGVSGPWRSIVASAARLRRAELLAGLLAQAPGGARDDEAQPDGEIGLGGGSHC